MNHRTVVLILLSICQSKCPWARHWSRAESDWPSRCHQCVCAWPRRSTVINNCWLSSCCLTNHFVSVLVRRRATDPVVESPTLTAVNALLLKLAHNLSLSFFFPSHRCPLLSSWMWHVYPSSTPTQTNTHERIQSSTPPTVTVQLCAASAGIMNLSPWRGSDLKRHTGIGLKSERCVYSGSRSRRVWKAINCTLCELRSPCSISWWSLAAKT